MDGGVTTPCLRPPGPAAPENLAAWERRDDTWCSTVVVATSDMDGGVVGQLKLFLRLPYAWPNGLRRFALLPFLWARSSPSLRCCLERRMFSRRGLGIVAFVEDTVVRSNSQINVGPFACVFFFNPVQKIRQKQKSPSHPRQTTCVLAKSSCHRCTMKSKKVKIITTQRSVTR